MAITSNLESAQCLRRAVTELLRNRRNALSLFLFVTSLPNHIKSNPLHNTETGKNKRPLTEGEQLVQNILFGFYDPNGSK